MGGRLLVAVAVGVPLVVVAVVLAVRNARRADAVDPEFRRDWKALPRARRREVALAVLRGRAVADPRDAALALRFAAQLSTTRTLTDRLSRPLRVVDVAVGAGAVAVAVYLGLTRGLRAALIAAPFALVAVTGAARERALAGFRNRLERAEAENQRLLEGAPADHARSS